MDLLAVPGKANSASRRDPSGCEDAEGLGSEHLDCSNAYCCHDRNPALAGFSKEYLWTHVPETPLGVAWPEMPRMCK